MHTVQYLQYFSGVCWALVSIRLWKPTWRSLFGGTQYLDPLLSVIFYFGVLQSGFVLRWAMYHGTIAQMNRAELSFWTALYALCAILGLWAFMVAGVFRDKQL